MEGLTQKQQRFCLNLFRGMSQRKAYLNAGYSGKAIPSTLDHNACVLANNSKVLTRLEELRKKAEDASIMSVMERKQKLSTIARSKLTDFMELGQDGSWVNIGSETENGEAIQEIHSRTEYDENGSHPTVYTSVKLYDPMKAIDLLNKMDGAYAPEKSEVIVYDGIKLAILDRLSRLTASRRAGEISEQSESIRNAGTG